MSSTPLMPTKAASALNDLLDTCAEIQAEQRVLILAHVDGLYGGPNLVDEQAIAWIQAGVQQRGAYPTVLWVDEPIRPYDWHLPGVLRAAIAGCDVFINNSFDLTWEEVIELRQAVVEHGVRYIRNFATTAPLLASDYAQTPHELVSHIRVKAGSLFHAGEPFQLTDPNGTHLEGTIGASGGMQYTEFRTTYRPFPEWVHPPITLLDTEGLLVFDRGLSWWTRYVGTPPFFTQAVRINVRNGRMTSFEGGDEADALRRFFATLAEQLGESVYGVPALHSGVHPNAVMIPPQVSNPLYRRLIEHQQPNNIHIHLGSAPQDPNSPHHRWGLWLLHVTADIRKPTFRVGDTLVHEGGHLTVLDDPEIRAIAARYPGRPGLPAH